jgi:ABC-type multidrug transport system fused ATPase/permease subunit
MRPNHLIFKNFNLVINPGQKAAFVGYSGCGKSTIIQLIERFYDVQEGQILIDNVDIRDHDLINLRRCIGIVMQEPVLFKRNVTENIRYGKLNCTEEEILNAAKKAHIEKFIEDENLQSNEIVSGGEKQRIAIARCIIKNPSILLLDEATSALDRANEQSVQKALDEIMVGRTSVVVAHR